MCEEGVASSCGISQPVASISSRRARLVRGGTVCHVLDYHIGQVIKKVQIFGDGVASGPLESHPKSQSSWAILAAIDASIPNASNE